MYCIHTFLYIHYIYTSFSFEKSEEQEEYGGWFESNIGITRNRRIQQRFMLQKQEQTLSAWTQRDWHGNCTRYKVSQLIIIYTKTDWVCDAKLHGKVSQLRIPMQCAIQKNPRQKFLCDTLPTQIMTRCPSFNNFNHRICINIVLIIFLLTRIHFK